MSFRSARWCAESRCINPTSHAGFSLFRLGRLGRVQALEFLLLLGQRWHVVSCPLLIGGCGIESIKLPRVRSAWFHELCAKFLRLSLAHEIAVQCGGIKPPRFFTAQCNSFFRQLVRQFKVV